jgi:hypothetical protein
VLNQSNELLELRDMPAENLRTALEQTRPLCWTCHVEERQRQAVPHRALKGERFGMASARDSI